MKQNIPDTQIMNKKSIYLRSISCKGIKSPIPFRTPSLYATVSLSTTSQRHQTPVDTTNGENPEWDCPMRFNLSTTPSDGQDLFLEFNLTVQVPLLGDRLVGNARVPVSDLMNGGSSGHVGYQVLWPDGKPNGTLQLWYEMQGSELPRYDMPYSSPEPSAPPPANFSYRPSVEPGPVYPPSVSGLVHYPQMPALAAYTSEPIYPGSIEPDRIYGAHATTEQMPYPPHPTSGLYPIPDTGFGVTVSLYPPPRTHNPVTDQAASISTYYPPPGNHNPPTNHAENGSVYYPPPGTRYPPVVGNAYEPVVAYPPGNSYSHYPPPPYE